MDPNNSVYLSGTLIGPSLTSCRSVDLYKKIHMIQEGTYGKVFKACDKSTGEIVALKMLKLDVEQNGFPLTSLREIHTLMLSKHPNIVEIKEIVVSPSLSGIFIVMEYLDYDLKGLLDSMPTPFLQSEAKTLMMQLLSAVECLHSNWIIHRDLKTSNLLVNSKGQLKLADFGLARLIGSPLGYLTQLVVTLWYRSPELLMGCETYTTAVDMWSVGCIFAELLTQDPLLPGRTEIDQLNKIFKLLGTPNEKVWPGLADMPLFKASSFVSIPNGAFDKKFSFLTDNGRDLLSRLLCYDPEKRISAKDALKHSFFTEAPLPKDPSSFPSFMTESNDKKRKVEESFNTKTKMQEHIINRKKGKSGQTSLFDTDPDSPETGFKLRF